MANDVVYQSENLATPAKETIIETEQQGDGAHRQVVKIGESALPTGAATAAAQAALLTEIQLKADLTETQPISAAALPLPSGAATSAAQTTGNNSLGNIETARGKLWDTVTSTFLGLSFRDGAPQILSQPYLQALAEGDIPGHVQWEKVGYTPTMTTAESVLWSKAGAYVFPAAGGIQMARALAANRWQSATWMQTTRSNLRPSPSTLPTALPGSTPWRRISSA
jgi:hypothetical protein